MGVVKQKKPESETSSSLDFRFGAACGSERIVKIVVSDSRLSTKKVCADYLL
jgi:hypothetical protein